MVNEPGSELIPAPSNSLNALIPQEVVRRLLWLPDHARSMGIHLVAGRGSGKSRLLGRIISWLDFIRGIPLVLFDPVGGTIDNFLDKMVSLPRAYQEKLWPRVVYVDFAGSTGHVVPFPLYYRLGSESLYTVSQRYIETIRRLDPQLESASIYGLNAIAQLGIPVGMVLAALGFQITEAEDLIRNPQNWSRRLEQAVKVNPEVASAVSFLREFAQFKDTEQERLRGSLLTKIAPFGYDLTLKALMGASQSLVDWPTVVKRRLVVLLDFRGVGNPELRRFLLLHVFTSLFGFIKLRGIGRHRPLSVCIDEVKDILQPASGESPLLADDLDSLVNVYMRNTNTWLTLAHQHNWQLSERIQKSLMSLGTQIVGVSQDPGEAMALAAQFFRYDPYWVKKTEPVYSSFRGSSSVIDEHTVEFTPEEQVLIHSEEFRNLKRFHFLVRPALAEGDVTGSLHHISIEHFDEGMYPSEELAAKARQLLAKRCGVPVETILAEIAGRNPTLSAPRSLPQGTIEKEGASDGKPDDFSDEQYLRRKRTPATKTGKGSG